MNNPKGVVPVPITPPPVEQRVRRHAVFAREGEKKTRYSLPNKLESHSPVGYRTRVALTMDEIEQALPLLSLEPPTAFATPAQVSESELFEECTLGILTARQSTNYRGHRQVTFGPDDSERIAHLLRSLEHSDAEVLDDAMYTHVALCRPYRTPFTFLLTFIGHKPVLSLATVIKRAVLKQVRHIDDIPTIGYLRDLHVGIWADATERAAVLASYGKRRAQVHMAPFTGAAREANKPVIHAIEEMCGLDLGQRTTGWRVAFVAQVGQAIDGETVDIEPDVCRKVGANLVAFRSERIQPGINQEDKAPDQYHHRQDMDVPEELTVMAGRAGYNAFARWAGVERERAKDLLLLERIDVLTETGKQRLREVRSHLDSVTDRVMAAMPLWADLPTGKLLSRNAARGKKAFALAGQRIYIGGLSRPEITEEGIDWDLAVRATGAAAARSSLVAELMGVAELPDDCDLLAGICLMAGPVNQNDVGKEFFGEKDLLASQFPGRDPTSLLVWTLKAKTIADPIGNEEQLLNPKRKGALVDLRPGPHEVIQLKKDGQLAPMRSRDGKLNRERAFHDIGNFVTDPDGAPIEGNRGEPWPDVWRKQPVW